jgi:hypothetical protein
MSRAVALTGALLVALSLGLFGWKTVVLGMPLLPSDPVGLWSVELDATARGSGDRGSLRAALPSSGPGQRIFDEHSTSDRLVFTIRTQDDQRIGVWSGRFAGVHRLSHGFRVQLSGVRVPLAGGAAQDPPAKLVERYTAATTLLPAGADEVASILETLALPGAGDPVARLRALFTYVADEIQTVPSGSDDAVLTLLAREGSPKGTARLLATLLRASGIPARLALGLRLRDRAAPQLTYGAHAWVNGLWVPLEPAAGQFAERPSNELLLRLDSLEPVEDTGIGAVGFRYDALPERLRPEEVAAMMLPPTDWLASLSLYRLPVATQSLLRSLLVLPLGALLVAVFRNMIGIPTYGTFLPILVAFALRGTSLGAGLVMVAAIIALAIVGRLGLERLRLLLVPRLAFLLCLIVLGVVALALAGRGFENRDLYGGVLFPLVILTMLAERFSITMQEEGVRAALVRAGWTAGVVLAVYPVFESTHAAHALFGFPELVVGIMGLLVWIGGYTGFRVWELIRFRTLARPADGDGA